MIRRLAEGPDFFQTDPNARQYFLQPLPVDAPPRPPMRVLRRHGLRMEYLRALAMSLLREERLRQVAEIRARNTRNEQEYEDEQDEEYEDDYERLLHIDEELAKERVQAEWARRQQRGGGGYDIDRDPEADETLDSLFFFEDLDLELQQDPDSRKASYRNMVLYRDIQEQFGLRPF